MGGIERLCYNDASAEFSEIDEFDEFERLIEELSRTVLQIGSHMDLKRALYRKERLC